MRKTMRTVLTPEQVHKRLLESQERSAQRYHKQEWIKNKERFLKQQEQAAKDSEPEKKPTLTTQ